MNPSRSHGKFRALQTSHEKISRTRGVEGRVQMRPTFLGFSPASNQQAGLAQTRPDLAQALERVVDKRDAVTRTKALAMVVQLVEDPTAAAPDLDALLEAFAVPFAAVGYDPAWRVRAALHGALGAVVRVVVARDPKALQRHVKALLPLWLLHQWDGVTEVAAAARTSFEATAIKAERVPALLQFCRVPLLAQLRWQLTASAKALGDTHSLSSKEAGEVCENIVGASLLLLKHYVTVWPMSPQDCDAELADLLSLALRTHAKSTVPKHRRALFALLTYTCTRPELFAAVRGAQLDGVVLGSAFADGDVPGLELLAAYLQRPEAWAEISNPMRSVWQPLWDYLQRTCRTVDPAVFGYVLPLVATAPNEAGLGGKALLFANKLFECFWDASLRQTVLANVAQTLGHLGDCLMLLAKRYEAQTAAHVCGVLMPRVLVEANVKLSRPALAAAMAPTMKRIAELPADRSAVCWSTAVASVLERLEERAPAFAVLVNALPASASCPALRAATQRLALECVRHPATLVLGASLHRPDADAATMWDALMTAQVASIVPATQLLVSLAAADWPARRAALLAACAQSDALLERVLDALSPEDRGAIACAELDTLVMARESTAVAACRGPGAPALTPAALQQAVGLVSWPRLAVTLALNSGVSLPPATLAVAFCSGLLPQPDGVAAHPIARVDHVAFAREATSILRAQVSASCEAGPAAALCAQLVQWVGMEVMRPLWPLAPRPWIARGLGAAGLSDERCFDALQPTDAVASSPASAAALKDELMTAAVALELRQWPDAATAAHDLLVAVWCGWWGARDAMAPVEDATGFHPAALSAAHAAVLHACWRLPSLDPAPVPVVAALQALVADRHRGPLVAAHLARVRPEVLPQLLREGSEAHRAWRHVPESDDHLAWRAAGNVRGAALRLPPALGADHVRWAVHAMANVAVDSWAAIETVSLLSRALSGATLGDDTLDDASLDALVLLLQHRCWCVQACAAVLLERATVVSAGVWPRVVSAVSDAGLDAWSRLVSWWPLLHHHSDQGEEALRPVAVTEFALFANDCFELLLYDDQHADPVAPVEALVLTALQPHRAHDRGLLAAHLWFLGVEQHRVVARAWFRELRDRELSDQVLKYTTQHVCPVIVAREMAQVATASVPGVALRPIAGGSAVEASLSKDDLSLQMRMQFPKHYPLGVAEVVPANNGNFPEHLQRRWVLSMTVLLQSSSGSLVEACRLWSNNARKVLDNLENCVICFCVLNEQKALPNVKCTNCNSCFHAQCVAKWFASSHSSKCCMCQMPWDSKRAF